MIVTENLNINGKSFIKTYSNNGYLIERDGVHYSEAIDLAELNRTYTETNIPIDTETLTDLNEATTEDLYNALAELGVS